MQRVNALNFDRIDLLIQFKLTGAIPGYIQTARQRANFLKHFTPFRVNNNRLFLGTREVIHKNDTDDILTEMYKQYPAHGLNQFYDIIKHAYININKMEVVQFLREQTLYQLTLRKSAKRITVKQYSKANQAWAIDLIDMQRYSNIQANRKYKYILSTVDLFSKKVYLRKLLHKTVTAVIAELTDIFRHERPKLLVSDNGKEFQLQQFVANQNMKQIFQPSHVPQPNIENTNGQVRKMLSTEFVKNDNLVWITRLEFLENNLNHFNIEVRQPKAFNNVQLPQNLFVGDPVRVSYSVFESEFRKNIKSGDTKYNNVKYTTHVFTIHRVYKPKTANGLSSYAIADGNGAVVVENNGTITKIKQNELQKIPQLTNDNGIDTDTLNTTRLNKHKGPGHRI